MPVYIMHNWELFLNDRLHSILMDDTSGPHLRYPDPILFIFSSKYLCGTLPQQCAMDAFGGRKTFLAVKGCYERNFVVFKQIYAFETFTANMHHQNPTQSEGGTSVDQEASNQRLRSENETERLREYERKIYAARKAGFHVGNLSSRILDHWHRMGWYALFYHR